MPTLTRSELVKRIRAWQEDDKQGYDTAIGLLCAAADKLADVDALLRAHQEPSAPVHVEDALHDVFTRHGIASRSDYPYALIGDLIRWAAQCCRQSQSAEARAREQALREIVPKIADAIQKRGRKASSGEPLFFDRFNLERAIADELGQLLTGPEDKR